MTKAIGRDALDDFAPPDLLRTPSDLSGQRVGEISSPNFAGFVPQAGSSTTVVISQIYGGGGGSGATLKNDYVELFNAGPAAVNLTGWSVQYASSTGSTWQVTALSGSLQPGQYYLVQEVGAGGGTVNLPTPDATGNIALSSTAGKIALAITTLALSGSAPTASVVDFVGYGTTADASEGSPAPAPSNTLADFRTPSGHDTNDNSADFTTGAPDPRNSSSAFDLTAANDAYGAQANAVLTVPAAGVLANDFGTAVFSVNGASANVGQPVTLTSGALLTLNSDGSFSYDPNHAFDDLAAASSGAQDIARADTFTYSDGANSATVTVTVNGVDNSKTVYVGSGGNDTITGGNFGNLFNLTQGGSDTATGGSGNDGFAMGAGYDTSDRINGGAGSNDQIQLDGVYGATIQLNGTALKNLEVMAFGPTHSYAVASNGTLTTAGQTFTFWSASMAAPNNVAINVHLEPGNFHFYLGQGNDTATGGTGSNLFYGEGGADQLSGNTGVDTFAYLAVSDSTGSAIDRIFGFTAGQDKFDLPVPVNAIDTAVTTGGGATADAAVTAAIGSAQLTAHDAVLFTADSGAVSGHTYLVVDANGAAGYQSGQDFLFDVTGMTGTLTTSAFV